jgi:predicted nucleic acid-binding protein
MEVEAKLAGVLEAFIASFTNGELLYGSVKSTRSADNVRRIQDFDASITVLGCIPIDAFEALRLIHNKRLLWDA